MTKLKLSSNKESVLNEIGDGKFNLDFDGYILHLKSFIPKEQCNQIVSSLRKLEKDKSLSVYSKDKNINNIFKKTSNMVYKFLRKEKKILPIRMNYFPGFGSDFHYFGTKEKQN